jgi:hypothetical protein
MCEGWNAFVGEEYNPTTAYGPKMIDQLPFGLTTLRGLAVQVRGKSLICRMLDQNFRSMTWN